MLQNFLTEIWSNLSTYRDYEETPIVRLEAVTDCRGLFDSLVASEMGKITDKG